LELNPDQRAQLLGPVAESDEPGSLKQVETDTKFVEQDPKDKGRKGVVYGARMTREEMIQEIQTQVLFAVEGALGKLLPGKFGDKHRKRLRGGKLAKDKKTKKSKWED
jgi:hypothetical protein